MQNLIKLFAKQSKFNNAIIIFQTNVCFNMQCNSAKYQVLNELESLTSVTEWINQFNTFNFSLCQTIQNFNSFGQSNSAQAILWKRTYQIQKTKKLYVYFELYLSGLWNDQELQIFGNGVQVQSNKFTLSDSNRNCNENFKYSTQVFFIINQEIDQFILEIKVTQSNLGLFIQNIILMQLTQVGRNEFIPFFDYIPICANSNAENNNYQCQCEPELVFQDNKCQEQCDVDYLYIPQTNECQHKQYCENCGNKNEILSCNIDAFVYTDPESQENYCVMTCPQDYMGDQNSKSCIQTTDYLTLYENNGYPVNHYYFFKTIDDFFHFYLYNDFKLNLISQPQRIKEKPFFYQNQQFVVGSYERFQSQVIELISDIDQSQYKLLFRGIGHFIDFYPSQLNVYINHLQILFDINQIIISNTNEQSQLLLDYQIQFELQWVRQDETPILQNLIRLQIEQPLQNGDYIGYFYLDNIHLYQYECMTNCQECYNSLTCPPCTNPENKNPKDCTCNIGYGLLNDICIACPTYCTSCTSPGVCDGCNIITKRSNPPNCNICPQQYFLQSNVDNCQQCINGCQLCVNNTTCQKCLLGYFRDSQNHCVLQCTDGYYNDSSDINDPKCSVCDINCLTCENLSTKCLSCNTGALLVNNYCLTCQIGYYLDNTVCKQCTNGCQNCNQNQCNQCFDSYYLNSNNQCVNICQDGYFGNLNTRTCDLCDINCKTCSDSTQKDCLTCFKGKW